MGALPHLAVVAGPQRQPDQRPVHRALEQRCADPAIAAKTALINYDKESRDAASVTYASLNAHANRLARSMLARLAQSPGAQPNTDGDWIVAVCMAPSADLIAVLLACWKMGAAYLPLEASFPRQRIEHIVAEARPALVVVGGVDIAEESGPFGGIGEELWRFGDLQADAEEVLNYDNLTAAEMLTAEDAHQLAIVLYTSGSTGIPKGVRLPHSILQNRLRWQLEQFPFAESEQTAVFKTALTFVDSVAEIWAPLLEGRAVLIVPKWVLRDPERLVDVLEGYQIERLVLVPTLLRTLLMYLPLRGGGGGGGGGGRGLPALRLWVCSGETLSAQLAAEFYAYFGHGAELCNFYGSTEIMGDVTYYVCPRRKQLEEVGEGIVGEDEEAETTIPIGYPIANTIVYVLDADLRPVRVGERGELYVAGRNLAAGYVGGREKFRFVANPMAVDEGEYYFIWSTNIDRNIDR